MPQKPQDRWPKPTGWIPLGRGNYMIPDPDTRFPALDRDAARAPRPERRSVRSRTITVERKTYTAFDAHSLLEHEDPAHGARPGHPLG